MKPATKPGRGLRIADQIQRDVAEMIQREVSVRARWFGDVDRC